MQRFFSGLIDVDDITSGSVVSNVRMTDTVESVCKKGVVT